MAWVGTGNPLPLHTSFCFLWISLTFHSWPDLCLHTDFCMCAPPCSAAAAQPRPCLKPPSPAAQSLGKHQEGIRKESQFGSILQAPSLGHFNLHNHINTEGGSGYPWFHSPQQGGGMQDMAGALTWVFHPCSHLLKLHTTAHTVPSLQLPLSWGEQRRKLQRESRPGEHLLSSLMGHGSQPPQPKGTEVTKVIALVFEHKNPALESKKGQGTQGQGGNARHGSPGCMGKGTQGSHRTDTHLHSRRVS